MVRRVCARTTTRTTMRLSSLVRTGTTSKWFATHPGPDRDVAQAHYARARRACGSAPGDLGPRHALRPVVAAGGGRHVRRRAADRPRGRRRGDRWPRDASRARTLGTGPGRGTHAGRCERGAAARLPAPREDAALHQRHHHRYGAAAAVRIAEDLSEPFRRAAADRLSGFAPARARGIAGAGVRARG